MSEIAMTPFDALKFLNDATASVNANRDVHIRIQLAVNTLAQFLEANHTPDNVTPLGAPLES